MQSNALLEVTGVNHDNWVPIVCSNLTRGTSSPIAVRQYTSFCSCISTDNFDIAPRLSDHAVTHSVERVAGCTHREEDDDDNLEAQSLPWGCSGVSGLWR